MMAKEYVVAGEVFRTKAAVADRAREVLKQSPRQIRGQDERFVLDLLGCHPEAVQKVGVGVAGVEVRRNVAYGQHEFWLTRVDGTSTDFSFLKCVTPPTPGQNFRLAIRAEIHAQVIAFKVEAFRGVAARKCPVTGEVFDWEGCHIDHEPPDTFAALAETFFGNPAKVEVTGMTDGSTIHSLKDRGLAARWQEYHATHARLRAVSIYANLSVIGR
jgi:hypothetical protein